MHNDQEPQNAQETRVHLESAKKRVEQLEARLRGFEQRCNNGNHNWGQPKYDPIHHEAYTSPGDRPGTMGVDWRGPTYVPARTEDRWVRECRDCGLKQTTKYSTKKVTETKIPSF